jgi:hypothetical protein
MARKYACRVLSLRMFAAKNSTNRRLARGPAASISAGTTAAVVTES